VVGGLPEDNGDEADGAEDAERAPLAHIHVHLLAQALVVDYAQVQRLKSNARHVESMDFY
jgi:hypothetical protein